MNKYQAWKQREREAEDLMSKLNQQNRETNRNLHDFEGWADKIMRNILNPLGEDATQIWNPLRNSNVHYKAEK